MMSNMVLNIPVKQTAKQAGFLYLAIFLAVPISAVIGRSALALDGLGAGMAANLIHSELQFRIGMAAESIVFVVEVVLAAVLYVLLKPVNQPLSLAAAFFRLGEAFIQAVNLITSAMVVMLVRGEGSLAAAFEPEQLSALAMLFLDTNAFIIMLWGLFFGFHLLLLGYLVYRSGFWPGIIGILLMLASLGYLVQSYGHIIAPQFDSVLSTVVLILAIPGELVFTAWLLWKGIDVERWKALAQSAS